MTFVKESHIFTKGHKFKVVTFAQSCDLYERSQVWTQTRDVSKGHKFKFVTFRKVSSLGPNL